MGVEIDPLSRTSLLVETFVNGKSVMSATGFIVKRSSGYFLITNWHVVTNKNPVTKLGLSPTLAEPDSIRIRHHLLDKVGWQILQEPLYFDDGVTPRWIAHQDGNNVDVIALPLTNITPNIAIHDLPLEMADVQMILHPSMPISIIGYPYGLSASNIWPIWKTGHLATDPEVNYDNKPSFLIDATTRSGMSGSPVAIRISGAYMKKQGVYTFPETIIYKFLGIYSGRLDNDVELGRVWRPNVLLEIFDSNKIL